MTSTATEFTGFLPPGTELFEYSVERVLGHGGFGITYLARDTHLDKIVAIKEYLPVDLAFRVAGTRVAARTPEEMESFKWGKEQFLKEARALARFTHPNLIQVHRFFEANNTAYFVMEYAEGETLGALLKREPVLPEERVRGLLSALLNGMEVVHREGFLHRDIKPENIILRQDGNPVLIDFGAARVNLGSKTRSVLSTVTAGYAPLEQYSAEGNQGPWTDIYALGAVAYRALSGSKPNDAINRLRKDPLMPAVMAGQGRYASAFLKAVDWALAVNPEDRPQSISDWRQALAGTLSAPARKMPPSTPPGSVEGAAGATEALWSARTAAQGARLPPLRAVARAAADTGRLPRTSAAVGSRLTDIVTRQAPTLPWSVWAGIVVVSIAIGIAIPSLMGWREIKTEAPMTTAAPARVVQAPAGGSTPQTQNDAGAAVRATGVSPPPAAGENSAAKTQVPQVAAASPAAVSPPPAKEVSPPPAATKNSGLKIEAPRLTAPPPLPAAKNSTPSQSSAAAATKPQPAVPEAKKSPLAVAQMAPLSTFQDCPQCPLMVTLPAASYRMGSLSPPSNPWELPVHTVTFKQNFAIGRYEVTAAQWQACSSAGACTAQTGSTGNGNLPAVNLTWDDARAYTAWLTRLTKRQYRLPSEAEWEYALRAGTTSARYWGEDRKGQCFYANGADLSARALLGRDTPIADCDDGSAGLAAVGSLKPNHFGLYDMAGNVWEWTLDCWRDSYDGAPADGRPVNVPDCQRRVIRGGSWSTKPESFRSASRGQSLYDHHGNDLGLRVVAE